MAKSDWNDSEARACIDRYAPLGGEALALRLYTARLIGRNPELVLHGGGNVSVKTTARTVLGTTVDVVRVKASGRDLKVLEPDDLPAMELAPLRALRALAELGDDAMVNEARRSLLDTRAPNPSVELLLHAFLPDVFVDHTHADAVLELTNQPDGAAIVREALGERAAVLPWIMPGFALARAVADARDRHADCTAVVVLHHGLFTFAGDARQSYESTIELVDRARGYVAQRTGRKTSLLAPPGGAAAAADPTEHMAAVLPVLRGALARGELGPLGFRYRRVVADWRGDADLIAFSQHGAARELVQRGPITPDHAIRTKGAYLWLGGAAAADHAQCRAAVRRFAADYIRWFRAHASGAPVPAMDDPFPRVAVVEGAGVVGFGADRRAAAAAADIAAGTLRSIARAEALGRYLPVAPADLWRMEYWPLERAKLGDGAPPVLGGQVALVTGAAGAIGHGIADALLGAGAHVVLTDLSEPRLDAAVAELAARHPRERIRAVTADVTSAADVARLFRASVLWLGGIDVVVPNAGIAHVSAIADLDPDDLRKVLEVNVLGTMNVLKEAARVFAAQRTGGAVVVQSSKNVFDPGAGFGAYSASKAAAHQLGKIAALELAPLGVRVNMINADAVFGEGEIKSGLWEQVGPDRMRARGLDPEGLRRFYRERSLLKTSVTPAHVGQAVVFFASELTPTTGATLPVDAGIPGAFPR